MVPFARRRAVQGLQEARQGRRGGRVRFRDFPSEAGNAGDAGAGAAGQPSRQTDGVALLSGCRLADDEAFAVLFEGEADEIGPEEEGSGDVIIMYSLS
jgi:hypothetical protein